MVLVFSGIDGSGKSTSIYHVIKLNDDIGRSSQVIWSRIGYTSAFMLVKRLIRTKRRTPNRITEQEKNVKENRRFRLRHLWLFIAMVDFFVVHVIYVRYRLLFIDLVVLDRGIEDSRIDVLINFGLRINWFWHLCDILAPQSKRLFLQIPYQTSIERCKDKFDPFAEGEFRSRKRYLYYYHFTRMRYEFIVDTTMPIQKSLKQIEKYAL